MIYVTAPIFSESGYGHKARGIVTPIVQHFGNANVFVENYPWGTTPETGLSNASNTDVIKHLTVQKKPLKKPDVHIHIGIPTTMKPIGAYNICFTSGVETDKVPVEWILHINNSTINELIVPSTFVKDVFENTFYISNDNTTKLKLTKTVRVVSEEYDPRMLEEYNPENDEQIQKIFESLGNNNYFLSCGQIGITRAHNVFAGRKNEAQLIISFTDTFSSDDNVTLLLKTNPVTYSELDYRDVTIHLQRCKSMASRTEKTPPIKLIKGHLNPQQLFYLMSHERNLANVSFTHGEGFGRFLLEASLSNRPLIVPLKGAHRDYTDASFTYYIKGKYEQIPDESRIKGILISDSRWYNVDEKEASTTLRRVYNNAKVKNNSSKIIEKIKEKFHPDNVGRQIISYIKPHVKTNIITDIKI